MTTNPQNYKEFWDFYVSEHSLPLTRVLHFTGTSLGIILAVFFVIRGQWYFFPIFFLSAMALRGSPISLSKGTSPPAFVIHFGHS